MNLKHLRYFWAVARFGGVSRAAEKLDLTPQTLSGQVAELQAHPGNARVHSAEQIEQIKASMRGDALPAGGATVTPAAAAPEVAAAPDEPLSQ